MDAENELPAPVATSETAGGPPFRPPRAEHPIHNFFVGPHGLRAGWSVALFFALKYIFQQILLLVAVTARLLSASSGFTVQAAFVAEVCSALAIVAAAAIVAFLARRKLSEYNLADASAARHFFAGSFAGFAAISALVGVLYCGGWLRFGRVGLSGAPIAAYAAGWAAVFIVVAIAEEGTSRCFLLATLAQGINFWWAAAAAFGMNAYALAQHAGGETWGVVGLALLGIVPCYALQKRHAPSAGFWNAAWATSVYFGFIHRGNGGESWVGLFAAGAIGFIFCVAVRLTGSVWWALGCHAAWDWGETYFWGTSDSGLVTPGHVLTAVPTGAPVMSGGTVGPEGSLLVLPLLLLLLLAIVALYGRGGSGSAPARPDNA